MNSINWILVLFWFVGGLDWYGSSFIHNKSSLNQGLQWHLWCSHAHCNSQFEIVFSSGFSLNVLAFMKRRQHDLFNNMMSFFSFQTPLLCLLMWRAWMYCFWQLKSICSHVSCSNKLHIEHVMVGYVSLLKNYCFF